MGNKKIWIVTIEVVLLFSLLAGTYVHSIFLSFSNTIEAISEPHQHEKSEKRQDKVILEKKEPFSALILGVDEREKDAGRSDAMVVITVNPTQNSVKIVSIPRDIKTEIIGRDMLDKINHAYAFGGVEMSIATVENLLDIPIDFYIKINMEGFKDIIDAVGGITVENTIEFEEAGHIFTKGTIELNGESSLLYVRMRKEDPNGDFGRQERQRQIIQNIIKKGASLSTLSKYEDLLHILKNNVKTNLSFNEMMYIQQHYKQAGKRIETIQMNGKGKIINGTYYLIITEEEKATIQQLLKEHLHLALQ